MSPDGEPLPAFPALTQIGLAHVPRIRELVAPFPPYSDFSPISLWAWSAAGHFRVAESRHNLVVEFGDYLGGGRFLSFLGTHDPVATAAELLEVSPVGELRLVPEIVARALAASGRFTIECDADARDYLYDPRDYPTLDGPRFRGIRRRVGVYERAGGDRVDVRELSVGAFVERVPCVLALVDEWLARPTENARRSVGERESLTKLLDTLVDIAAHACLILRVATWDDRVVAFSIHEHLDEANAICHFAKTDGRFTDQATALFVDEMRHWAARGVRSFNFEQDLGLPGLRTFKQRLKPSASLEKFTVRPA